VKVLLLTNTLENGGLERQLVLLATHLPPPWEPLVWSMGRGVFLDSLLGHGVDVLIAERRARLDPRPAVALRRVLRDWRPDVVHAWGWMPATIAAPLCRALRLPFVNGTIRSGALEPDHTCVKRVGMALSTLVVANSRAGLDAWRIGRHKGVVVRNGFDTGRFDRLEGTGAGRAPYAAVPPPGEEPPGGFTVVMTGRMAPVKHYSLVIEAARALSSTEDGWRFLLVGDGSDRQRLMVAAADLTRRGVVEFPPPGIEVLRWVCEADAGVLMTDPRIAREGLSNSIMEYMAAGLPVVCGEGGGNPELVVDGVTGFVIPPGDEAELVDRLRRLRAQSGLARRMGAAGRERIAVVFSTERMVRRMLEVYAEAMARTAGTLR